MLDHLGDAKAARAIHQAVGQLLSDSKTRTPDLGGTAKTEEVGSAVAALISSGA
jgi:tartrate dehydrogenase/decarboxylase/D-malate dehydrogenase